MEPVVDLAPTAGAAFRAAYDALVPYTRHAEARTRIAEHVVQTLARYHLYGAVEVMLQTWPQNTPRLNRVVLTEVADAAARVDMTNQRCDLPPGTLVRVKPLGTRTDMRPFRARIVGTNTGRTEYEVAREYGHGLYDGGGWWVLSAEVGEIPEVR